MKSSLHSRTFRKESMLCMTINIQIDLFRFCSFSSSLLSSLFSSLSSPLLSFPLLSFPLIYSSPPSSFYHLLFCHPFNIIFPPFHLIRITGGSLPKSYSDLFPDDSDNERNTNTKKNETDTGNPRILPPKKGPKKEISVKSTKIDDKKGSSNRVSGPSKNIQNYKEIERNKLGGNNVENKQTKKGNPDETKPRGKNTEVEKSRERDKSNERGRDNDRNRVKDKDKDKKEAEKDARTVNRMSASPLKINAASKASKTNKNSQNKSSSPSYKNDPQNALGSEFGPPMSPPRLAAPPLNKTRPPSFSQQNVLEDGVGSISLK